ncbi:MAG TPA: serine protease [Woeseiaceae bacterium]|nr:serine protease [Woeseiaceae bacterium]
MATAQERTAYASAEALFDGVSPSVCTVSAVDPNGNATHRGSGFIMRGSGLLVTNAHVLAGLPAARVTCGGVTADVRSIVNYDPGVDLVLANVGEIAVDGLDLSNQERVRPGAQIYVVSSPYGLEGTISPGLASGHREIQGQTYVQISAPISAGSSGGPVVDQTGAVIGVTVASLEVAQNINFALPVSAISALPSANVALADLGMQKGYPEISISEPADIEDDFAASGSAEFRGFPFGTPCGEIAVAEYQRKDAVAARNGSIRFPQSYSGELEFDVSLYGEPASLVYRCDEQHGLIEGSYVIADSSETVDRMISALTGTYGVGVPAPISEQDAEAAGCRWNYSLPGSRHYRPSRLETWAVDDRLRIDLLVCGGKSESTFVTFSDPVLVQSAQSGEQQASWRSAE